MKYDIFISYSRKDIEFARKVCAVLDSYKQYYDFEYFFDQSEITSANEYLDRISSAIYDSKAVLFIASKDAYASKFCAKELLFADNKNKSIHQYRMDKADVPQKLEMLLGTHQYRELSSTPIECEVREILKEVLGGNVLSLEELKAKESKHKSEGYDVQPTTQTEDKSSNHHRNKDWLKRPAVWLSAVAVVVIAVLMTVLGKNSDDGRYYIVGDFYDDGTKQGVVFEVSEDGKHGKIVSLDETKKMWCIWGPYEKEIFVGASGSDGQKNTDRVMARTDSANFPAFQWCKEKGPWWYLPSKEELLLLYEVKDKVNRTLQKESMQVLDSWYWSSTEYNSISAWYVYMLDGSTDHRGKTYDVINVRAVATF